MDVAEPKRLVGLIHALDVGGAERMMVTILNHFVSLKLDVHLIIFDNRGELKGELSEAVVVHDLLTPSVMRGMPKCLKELKSIKPDIVFTGIGHLNIALAPFVPMMRRLLPKSKWISRETNIVSLQNQSANHPKVFDFLYRHVYNNYDMIVAQSEDMKEDLRKNYFESDKIVVINNPIDYKKVNRLAKEEKAFTFDKRKINLLSVSRLREEKRHDLMLKTLSLLAPKYHLTIVGSGEKEASLRLLAKELKLENRVNFQGHQSNPYTYMKEADLFLLTSQREGFPNVLLEANSLGLAIVAFACQGGIKEIIDTGENGFFVAYEDCKGMAQQIEEAVNIRFNKENIKNRVIERYGEEFILNKYKNIFLY